MQDEQETKLGEAAERGVQARLILNNPLFKEAFVAIRAQLFEQFENTKFTEHALRDEAWRKLQSINYIEGYLSHVMQTGKMAEQTLKERVKSAARKIVGLK
jgi:hypothetical protein